MLPQITELEFDTEDFSEDIHPIGKSFLYDFKKGDFILKNGKPIEVYGIESLKIWIEKIIRTAKFKFKIYDDTEYGTTIDSLIGSNLPQEFIEAEIKRVVTEALLEHDHITAVNNWFFKRDGKRMTINFVVETIDESLEMEVDL